MAKRKMEMYCNPRRMKITPLYTLLEDEKLDFEMIKKRLERDSSDINTPNAKGRTPLIVLLQNKNCSAELISLLLDHRANIICHDPDDNYYPLLIALSRFKERRIIRVLVKEEDPRCRFEIEEKPRYEVEGLPSPLCVALQNFSPDIVYLLLEEGFEHIPCKWHESLLHCALSTAKSKFINEKVFLTLIQKQSYVNCLDSDGRTPFCVALMNGAESHHLDLLSQAGGSVFSCKMHDHSPLLCATEHKGCTKVATESQDYWYSYGSRGTLKAHVVQYLIKAGAEMNILDKDSFSPLQRALRYCSYEPAAIELLIGLPGSDPNVLTKDNEESLLYLAFMNTRNLKLEIVKLLIDWGVNLETLTYKGENCLFSALRGDPAMKCGIKYWLTKCLPSIKLLLKYGCPVNVKNYEDHTPLHIAIGYMLPYEILKVLFVAGARVDLEILEFESILWTTLSNRAKNLIMDSHFFLLLQFSVLQMTLEGTGDLLSTELQKPQEIALVQQFEREAQEMQHVQIGHGHTLLEFMLRPSLPQLDASDYKPEECNFDFDELLTLRPDRKFPCYFEHIASKVGWWALKAELEELLAKEVTICADSPQTGKVYLNLETVCKIAEFLSEEELLRLILAIYVPAPVEQVDNSPNTDSDDSL